MSRILVIGCSGAGKSTFARRLAEATGLPLVHIDQLYWRPGWKPAPREEFLDLVAQASAGQSWIMDGNNPSTFHLRMPRADRIVWFRLPRWRCLLRIVRRVIASYGRVRPDMAPGCPERFDWSFLVFVWNFERNYGPRIETALAEHDAWGRTILVHSDAEGKAALKDIIAAIDAGRARIQVDR